MMSQNSGETHRAGRDSPKDPVENLGTSHPVNSLYVLDSMRQSIPGNDHNFKTARVSLILRTN